MDQNGLPGGSNSGVLRDPKHCGDELIEKRRRILGCEEEDVEDSCNEEGAAGGA
jgi:hypothetical protein